MKRGGPTHPKTFELAERLHIRRSHAVGILELLFHFTAQYAPDGNIGRYSDKRIAAALDWTRKPEHLIDVLVETRWLDRSIPELDPISPEDNSKTGQVDRTLRVHDWFDHVDRATRQKLARLLNGSTQQNHNDTEKVCTQSDTHGFTLGSLPLPLPHPLPVPEPLPLPQTAAAADSKAKFPLTLAEIRRHDPAVDESFVTRLVRTTVQTCRSSPGFPKDRVAAATTDKVIAKACEESFSTGPANHRAGLLLKRVPGIILTWGTEERNGNG